MCIYIYIYISIYLSLNISIYLYIYIYISLSLSIYIYTIYIYIYIYTHMYRNSDGGIFEGKWVEDRRDGKGKARPETFVLYSSVKRYIIRYNII